MSTNYIAPIWRMPRNANKDKLSNYSINFGSTDYINFDSFPDIAENNCYSFSFWFKTTSTSNAQVICDDAQTNLFELRTRFAAIQVIDAIAGRVNSTQQLQNNVAAVTNDVRDGEWHHIVFIANTQTNDPTISNPYVGNLYLDGYRATVAPFGSPTTLAGVMASTLRLNNSFTGQISQFCFFNRVLTDGGVNQYELAGGEVAQLYSLTNPMILSAPPVVYTPLGDNSNPNAPGSFPNISVGADSVFDFNTSGAWIDCGNNPVFNVGTGDLSISAWVYPTSVSGNDEVCSIGTNGGTRFRLQRRSARIGAYIDSAAGQSAMDGSTPLSINQWYHFVLVKSGSNFNLYLNGSEVSEASYINSGSFTDTEVAIGQYFGGTGNKWAGELTNIQIWNSALTTVGSNSDLKILYNNGQPLMTGTQPQEANLQAWYKLNQSANWEADTINGVVQEWQIPDATSAYPKSFKFSDNLESVYSPNNLGMDRTKVRCVSFWYKNEQQSRYGYVVNSRSTSFGAGFAFICQNNSGTDSGYIFSTRYTGGSTGYINTGYLGTLKIPRDGNWHHVAFTHSETDQLKVYIDGVYIYQKVSTAASDGADPIRLRIGGPGSTQDISGMLSNMMIWEDVVLTDGGVALNDVAGGEIAQLYNNGKPLTSTIQSDKLLAWYKFDDTELFNGTNWSIENQKYPANYESALYFTGGTGNEHLETPSNSDLLMSGSHTFSAWINVNSFQVDSTNYIFDKGGGGLDYALGFTTNTLRLIYYNYYDSGGPSGTNIIINLDTDWKTKYENAWHHIVVSVDQPSLTVTLITDGTEISTHSLPADYVKPDQGGGILNIMSWTGTSLSLAGFISNLAFYNGTALTTAQALTLYNNGTPEDNISFSPTSWWKIDNTSTGLLDNAGTANLTNTGGVELDTFVSSAALYSEDLPGQALAHNNVSVFNGDSSGMTTANLVTSNISRTQPYSNYSFNFDSASLDYFDLGGLQGTDLQPSNTTLVADGFSVSVWVNVDDTSSARTFWQNDGLGISTYYGLIFLMNGGGQLNIGYNNGGGSGTGNRKNYITSVAQITSTGTWYHLVAIYKGIAVNPGLYVNGVEITSFTSSGTATTLAYSASAKGSIGVGRNGIQSMEGKISNCACFDRTLTQDEVLNIYNNGVPQDLQTASSFSNNIAAWWPMDGSNSYYDGTNWVVRDIENGNDGTGVNTGNVDDIVGNAPGSNANGSGVNLVIADLKGDMYDSKLNAYSINMGDYADGVTNPADSGRSTEIPTVP